MKIQLTVTVRDDEIKPVLAALGFAEPTRAQMKALMSNKAFQRTLRDDLVNTWVWDNERADSLDSLDTIYSGFIERAGIPMRDDEDEEYGGKPGKGSP